MEKRKGKCDDCGNNVKILLSDVEERLRRGKTELSCSCDDDWGGVLW